MTRLSFLFSATNQYPVTGTDATASHHELPRFMRKAMRNTTITARPSKSSDDVVSYMEGAEYRVDAYYNQNLEFLDRAYDHDEFGDCDDEYAGLTIHEPLNEIEKFQFLTGYDII